MAQSCVWNLVHLTVFTQLLLLFDLLGMFIHILHPPLLPMPHVVGLQTSLAFLGICWSASSSSLFFPLSISYFIFPINEIFNVIYVKGP